MFKAVGRRVPDPLGLRSLGETSTLAATRVLPIHGQDDKSHLPIAAIHPVDAMNFMTLARLSPVRTVVSAVSGELKH